MKEKKRKETCPETGGGEESKGSGTEAYEWNAKAFQRIRCSNGNELLRQRNRGNWQKSIDLHLLCFTVEQENISASKAQFLQVKKNAVKQPKKAQKVEAAPQPVPENKVVVQKKSLNKASSKAIPPSDPPEQKLTEAVEKLPVKEPIVEDVQCNVEQVSDPYDVDKESSGDPFMSSEYAKDIFDYLKERELKFGIESYINKQQDLNKEMRAILVDWMVEVQENFELNHETLYLSVKLVDHYLSEVICMRESLQLIGSTSMLLASKFEERCPPCVDDFLYICDDAYKREELINMEMNILRILKFDINIPIAYRFLRRYAKCAQTSMETLTLARYICELTLQELDFVSERASQLAAACLLLAMAMKKIGGWLFGTVAFYLCTASVHVSRSVYMQRSSPVVLVPSRAMSMAVFNVTLVLALKTFSRSLAEFVSNTTLTISSSSP
ncbi:CCNB3 protein, partial [Polypterus senegalus]